MKHLEWSFDFISPFAYLQSTQLSRFSQRAELHLRPVLFAGLLKHWGTKGPAELPSKRQVTYETIAWQAHLNQINLRFPPSHPFNPLPLLRLSILKGNRMDVVERLFHYVWVQGRLPSETAHWLGLLEELGIKPEQLDDVQVKAQLARNTEEAIAQDVFGVPTARCWDETSNQPAQLFWGFDATALVDAWLNDDPFFKQSTWTEARLVGAGVQRTGR
jgi:2-hydroxychromene-2-carboxylate isomerase